MNRALTMLVSLIFAVLLPVCGQAPRSRPYFNLYENPVRINPAWCRTGQAPEIKLVSAAEDLMSAHELSFLSSLSGKDNILNHVQGGAILHHEQFRFSRNIGAAVSGAYQFRPGSSGNHIISVGFSGKGYYNHRRTHPDLTIYDTLQGSAMFNADAGIFYGNQFVSFGISGLNLLGTRFSEVLPMSDPAQFSRSIGAQLGFMIPLWKSQQLSVQPVLNVLGEAPLKDPVIHYETAMIFHFRNMSAGASVRSLDFNSMAWFASAEYRAIRAGLYLHNPLTGYLTRGTLLMEMSLGFTFGKNEHEGLKKKSPVPES